MRSTPPLPPNDRQPDLLRGVLRPSDAAHDTLAKLLLAIARREQSLASADRDASQEGGER